MIDLPPGEALDRLFAEQVEGFIWDESRCRICGWPLGIEAHCTAGSCSQRPPPHHRDDGVAPVSADDSVALAALERFCIPRGAAWTTSRTLPVFPDAQRYCVTLYGHMMPLYCQYASTLAHAIVLAVLAAVDMAKEIGNAEQS